MALFNNWYGRIRSTAEKTEDAIRENMAELAFVCVYPSVENLVDQLEFSKALIDNMKISQTTKFLSGYNNYIIGKMLNQLFEYYEKNRKDKPLSGTDVAQILRIKPQYPKEKMKVWTWELNCLIFIPDEVNFDMRTIRTYRSFGKMCEQFPRLLFIDASIWEFQKYSLLISQSSGTQCQGG
jgi:hypothetical protein